MNRALPLSRLSRAYKTLSELYRMNDHWVTTDISEQGGIAWGAYFCSWEDQPRVAYLGGGWKATLAEIWLIEFVAETYRYVDIYHDVEPLERLINHGSYVASRLCEMRFVYGTEFIYMHPTARPQRYRQCHHAARIAMGLRGLAYPGRSRLLRNFVNLDRHRADGVVFT